MPKGSTKSMWIRMLSIMLAITVGLFGAVSLNLVKIMIFDSDFYQKKAAEQQLQDTVLTAIRGDILDRNGETLATSATVWTVYITPQDIENDDERKTIASGLSELLDVDYETVLAKTKKSTYYEIIKRKVEKTTADSVRKFISENKLGSIVGLDEGSKRYYPNDNLASTVLGFVGDDNQGLSGIEYYYETTLKGTSGRVIAAKNAKGADMPFSYEKVVDAQAGDSLVLTVDKYIQYTVEKYLQQAVEENNVTERGCAIAIDPNTGEIYAMATKDDFNPNDPLTITDEETLNKINELTGDEKTKAISEAQQKQWRNKAISDTYEPGSVFKIITGSSALEENVVSLNSHFSCPGYIVIAGTRYSCHKSTGHGGQDLAEAFQHSCNPAFISIGQSLGVEKFWKYFKSYGFTEKTGIDLPGEAETVAGVSYHEGSSMSIVDLASESFGQSFNVTPIQLATAVCAAVNGGYLVQPHVVKQVVDSEGNVKKTIGTTVKRQVISEETSKTLAQLLEGVVSVGSGKNAYVAGYRVGGKTGTSQKLAKEQSDPNTKYRISSFCGIAPADNPQIVVLIMLDEPHGANIYGGTIAAPVAGKIFADVLPYLGVEPQYTESELENLSVTPPNVIGKSVSSAKTEIESAGLTVKTVGDGETVERQVPSSGQSISKGGTVVLYTGTEGSSMVTVPNFTGLSASQVNELAAQYKLNVQFSGSSLSSGSVKSSKQSIAEGTEVEIGTVITVDFIFTDNTD